MTFKPAVPLMLTLALAGCGPSTPDYEACKTGKDPDARIAACTRVISAGQLSSPDLANVLHLRGTAWAGKRDFERAITDFDAALQANPIHAFAHYDRFMARQAKAEKPAETKTAKKSAAPMVKDAKPPASTPASTTDYISRGIAWAEKNDHDRAIIEYNEAIRLNPAAANAYYNRAIAWGNKRDYDRAITDYTEALRLNPQYSLAQYNRGVAWSDKRNYTNAISDYIETTRINPQYQYAHNSAAWLLATAPAAANRNGARAVEHARKAAELSAWKDGDILDTLAAAYAEAGNFQEAVRWQEKAMEFPDFMKQQAEDARARLALYRKGQPYRLPNS